MQKSKLVGLLRAVHLLSLAFWSGGTIFFSFVAAPRIFAFLRDQLPATPPPGVTGLTSEIGSRLAGATVGAVFPAYFCLQIFLGVLASGSGVLLARGGNRFVNIRNALTMTALVIVGAHAITIYPRSVGALDAYHRAQDAADETQAVAWRHEFGMLHGISRTLDLLVILLVVSSLVILALGDGSSRSA